jgi:hypothetical protein
MHTLFSGATDHAGQGSRLLRSVPCAWGALQALQALHRAVEWSAVVRAVGFSEIQWQMPEESGEGPHQGGAAGARTGLAGAACPARPLVLVDATVDAGGACTCWVADAAPDDLHSPGRLWQVTDYGAYRRLYPDLPDGWLERRTRPQYARLTVPSDGLLSARDTLAILERLLRPCQYRSCWPSMLSYPLLSLRILHWPRSGWWMLM